jgi:hypothetical protein
MPLPEGPVATKLTLDIACSLATLRLVLVVEVPPRTTSYENKRQEYDHEFDLAFCHSQCNQQEQNSSPAQCSCRQFTGSYVFSDFMEIHNAFRLGANRNSHLNT